MLIIKFNVQISKFKVNKFNVQISKFKVPYPNRQRNASSTFLTG